MKHAMKAHKGKSQASANVVDGKLILSFPNAINPVLWQMDLNDAKASALEVQDAPDGKACVLVLKTPKGDNLNVAPFAEKEQAVAGLMAAAQALENAHGQIRPAEQTNNVGNPSAYRPQQAQNKKSGGKWIGILFGIALIVILLFTLSALSVRSPQSINSAALSSNSAAVNPADATGVPVSADDFLLGQ